MYIICICVCVWVRARIKIRDVYLLHFTVACDSVSNELRCYHGTIVANCIQCLFLSLERAKRKKRERGENYLIEKDYKILLFSHYNLHAFREPRGRNRYIDIYALAT